MSQQQGSRPRRPSALRLAYAVGEHQKSVQRRHKLLIWVWIALIVVLTAVFGGSDAAHPLLHPVIAQTNGYSLRFFGNGVAAPGLDRVSIPLDAPARPVDIGATDFTIEFWLKATPGENNGVANCGVNDGWITGNTVIDRDIFGEGDYGDFGIAVSETVIAFGVSVGGEGATLCGNRVVVDDQWHHIAAVRRLDGFMQLFVDGQPAGSVQGVAGNASYRDNRSTNNPADPYLIFGAEKHDAGAAYPSFSGLLDEVRLSTSVRYTTAFTPPTAPFIPDNATAGLYHFDAGPVGACTGVVEDASDAAGGPSNGMCAYGGSPAGPVYVTDTPLGALPPTATDTPVAPTATDTPLSPTATDTPLPPTATDTPVAPTATDTPVAPTATDTPVAPTATGTPVAPTATDTPLPPTATDTPVAPTATDTPTSSPPSTTTPGGTIPPPGTSTPDGHGTPMLPPCPAMPTPGATADGALPGDNDRRLYLPFIQQESPCVNTTR